MAAFFINDPFADWSSTCKICDDLELLVSPLPGRQGLPFRQRPAKTELLSLCPNVRPDPGVVLGILALLRFLPQPTSGRIR
jgi:hypothetical protein